MKAKIVTSILSIMILFSGAAAFSGCAEPVQPEEPVDSTKTQLYIGNYNGGVGGKWLENAADRFEEKYKDTCFEPGTNKKGVQIHIDNNKERYHGNNLINNLSSITEQIIFTERAYYDEYVTSGKILDMTNAVTGDLAEVGETGHTIEEKIGSAQKEYLNRDGKYYAVPHYRLFSGIQYNVRLWEDEGYYFAEDGINFVSPGSTAEEEPRSLGPDGKTGVIDGVDYSLDDGLPATYEDFFLLCDYICETGNVPFVWTGQYLAQYTGYLYWALYADFEGAAKFMDNFDFSGTADDIVDGWNEDGTPVLRTAEITPQTGYELRQQLGRYYALSFLERLVKGNPERRFTYYMTDSFGLTYSNLNAQEDFIKSYYEGKPIAMIAEGTWWENEADLENGAFETAEHDYGASASRENSKFGFMPLPKATEELVGTPFTVTDTYDSYILYNSNMKGKEDILKLADLFVQFICTDEEMAEFTKTTGLPRALEYRMSEEDISALTYYEQQIWNVNINGDVVLPYSSGRLYRNNTGTLCYSYDWTTTVDGKPYSIPAKAFKDNGVTALQYFNGMKMSSSQWDTLYSKDF